MARTAMTFENKLELHFYFNDKSQYIDALIHHRCEREILTIIRILSKLLNVGMTPYCEHIDRGSGYTDLWSIAGGKPRSISIVLNALIRILTCPTPSFMKEAACSNKQEDLSQKDLELFRHRSENNPFATLSAHDMNLLCSAGRFIKCKSAFYEAIKGYPKITKFTIRELNSSNNSRSGSIEVRREDFDQHIIQSSDMTPAIDNSATIQILVPVLGDVKMRWKGIYEKNGQIIDFSMEDEDFLHQLVDDHISFSHGLCIDCILEISRKSLDEETINVGYKVLTVIRTRFGKVETVTPQGKRHLRELEAEKRQLKLDLFS